MKYKQQLFMYTTSTKYFIVLAVLTIIFSGCKKSNEVTVRNFNPLVNLSAESTDTVSLDVEIQQNIFDGIVVPEKGYIKFQFDVMNTSEQERRYAYKIFYRNDSYKFPEYIKDGRKKAYNPLASENFYGSWENLKDTLHYTGIIPPDGNYHTVIDSFRIVGNPRNERKFFGKSADENYPDINKIEVKIQQIKGVRDWYASIVEKAANNKRPVEEQIYLDALWTLRHEQNNGTENNRWKRNPRAGNYKFYLVVAHISVLPETITQIGKMDGDTMFVDPWFTLNHLKKEGRNGVVAVESDKVLDIRINFDLSKGIYYDLLNSTNPDRDMTALSSGCNFEGDLYKKAQIKQFFHSIDRNFILHSVPEVADFSDITQEDYDQYVRTYSENGKEEDYIRISDKPCETVSYDEEERAVVLINPPSDSINRRKENVGIKSRVGFTYGKVTAKIQFPEMLNEHGVWNGITNAFWLIYQEEGDWNHRRECKGLGYIPKSEVGETDVRVPNTFYSEIDIEIVKASKHWPPTSYYNNIPFPEDDPDHPRDIIVTCTNWDLACREPESFNKGVFKLPHYDRQYLPHRWDDWYKALTMKYAIDHDHIFKLEYYYFQIDWQPDRIIWRIGPSKNKLFEIGYLDSTVSSIPNNQMSFIVSQEFHHAAWWPTTTFQQDYIPYLSSLTIGKVYEVTIE